MLGAGLCSQAIPENTVSKALLPRVLFISVDY